MIVASTLNTNFGNLFLENETENTSVTLQSSIDFVDLLFPKFTLSYMELIFHYFANYLASSVRNLLYWPGAICRDWGEGAQAITSSKLH